MSPQTTISANQALSQLPLSEEELKKLWLNYGHENSYTTKKVELAARFFALMSSHLEHFDTCVAKNRDNKGLIDGIWEKDMKMQTILTSSAKSFCADVAFAARAKSLTSNTSVKPKI